MLYEKIKKYVQTVTKEFDRIPLERQKVLENIAHYMLSKKQTLDLISLVYICTHNSRRSHFGQIWATVASVYYNIHRVAAFSGGTEATAFNTNAITALQRIGFDIKIAEKGSNPVYKVNFSDQKEAILCFSKVYNHIDNPQSEFAAIMTCSDAEENCPFIPGVEYRIATPYADPKIFDNTPLQNLKYDERCRQMARETFYVFSKLNQLYE